MQLRNWKRSLAVLAVLLIGVPVAIAGGTEKSTVKRTIQEQALDIGDEQGTLAQQPTTLAVSTSPGQLLVFSVNGGKVNGQNVQTAMMLLGKLGANLTQVAVYNTEGAPLEVGKIGEFIDDALTGESQTAKILYNPAELNKDASLATNTDVIEQTDVIAAIIDRNTKLNDNVELLQ